MFADWYYSYSIANTRAVRSTKRVDFVFLRNLSDASAVVQGVLGIPRPLIYYVFHDFVRDFLIRIPGSWDRSSRSVGQKPRHLLVSAPV